MQIEHGTEVQIEDYEEQSQNNSIDLPSQRTHHEFDNGEDDISYNPDILAEPE